ncbi:collagenase-like [Cloeon dipterum]|uniref:collagenase-like n=1 Tax=Cloeon dipterum TaxID=197152 RepID=UPI003220466E
MRGIHAAMLVSTALVLIWIVNAEVYSAQARSKPSENERADTGPYPWQGHLRAMAGSVNKIYCGASLIAPKWALTAARCIDTAKGIIHIVTFGKIVSQTPLVGSEQRTATHLRHEQFDETNMLNDIALLTWTKEITPSDHIQPIALPRPFEDNEATFIGETVSISGFGRAESNSLYVADQSLCATSYINFAPNTNLCAKAKVIDQSTFCLGDTGGPLVYLNATSNTRVQIGIASHGVMMCSPDPSVYTRVTAYLPWIEANSGYDKNQF